MELGDLNDDELAELKAAILDVTHPDYQTLFFRAQIMLLRAEIRRQLVVRRKAV